MYMAGYVFPLRLRGWEWGALTGILHELYEILSLPTPSIFKVLFTIIEVAKGWVTETQTTQSSDQHGLSPCIIFINYLSIDS